MITHINIECIYPHPENPRKDIGDITELAESIKKNGIMQNLTVIPGHYMTDEEWKEGNRKYRENPTEELRHKLNERWVEGGYTLIIGHRRCAAAKAAGITEVPCKIVEGMSRKEQISTMLEENMQRNDLTIYEQAQGFQLMLDLGETEETISQKTGFSRTTVRRRLNLAKLDQETLKRKTEGEFQLTLTALDELAAIKNETKRNEILRAATDSNNLIWRAKQAVKDELHKERRKEIVEILKTMGVKKGPKGCENEFYGSKWEIVKDISTDKEPPKNIKLPREELYYCIKWDGVRVFKKPEKKQRSLSPEEQKQKEKDRKKKLIKAAVKRMNGERKDFIADLIAGHIRVERYMIDAVWAALMTMQTGLYPSSFQRFFSGKSTYDCTQEEREAAQKKVESLDTFKQMLVAMHSGMENVGDIFDWQGRFKEDIAGKLKQGYEILEQFGWSFSDAEHEKILDGSSELYERSE